MTNDTILLHQKLDYLIEQVDAQKKRQTAMDEFMKDFAPVFNQMFGVIINELDDIGSDFQLEDLLHLVKRLLRDTRKLTSALDQLEALMELMDELSRLGQPMMIQMTQSLDQMEHKGYFAFAQSGGAIMDKVVTEFDKDDLNALGNNIVTILRTVRNLTQPDVMDVANSAIDSIREDDLTDEKVTTWGLVREFNDPQVRKGLIRLLHVVKSLSNQTEPIPS